MHNKLLSPKTSVFGLETWDQASGKPGFGSTTYIFYMQQFKVIEQVFRWLRIQTHSTNPGYDLQMDRLVEAQRLPMGEADRRIG
jgi:hypothetical protein